jgi:type I restriction enzyme S subunit
MSEWKEYKLGDIIKFGNGKERPKTIGNIPVFGGNGILSYCNAYNYEGETIIIGRVGAYCGSVYYQDGQIWVSDNALSAKPKNNFNTKFLYHFLKNLQLNTYAEGSSHPLVTQGLLNSIEVNFLDSVKEQTAIASILSSLDDKIDLLHRQNKTLEALAETLFRQWFVEEVEEDSTDGHIGDIANFFNGKTRPNEPGNIPVYGGNGILGYTNSYNYSGKSIIIGRVGAYCGSLYFENMPVWVSDNALTTKAKNEKFTHYLYYLLKDSKLNTMAEGSSHPLITQTILKSIEIKLPPQKKVEQFDFQVNDWRNKIDKNNDQIRTLTQLRDNLLPKLMSGEVRVKI